MFDFLLVIVCAPVAIGGVYDAAFIKVRGSAKVADIGVLDWARDKPRKNGEVPED